jgi:nucleolar protein 9
MFSFKFKSIYGEFFCHTEMFVVNVFEQTKGKEMDLICNQVVSKIMEKLLPLANSENLQHFADLMLNDMRIICTDPYASHVLEKVCY